MENTLEVKDFHTKEIVNPDSIQLAMLSTSGKLEHLWIPIKAEGKYTLSDSHDFLSIEAINGVWHALCEKDSYFINEKNEHFSRMSLQHKKTIALVHKTEKYILYVEHYNGESKVFHNYSVPMNCEIGIGRSEDNVICYPIPYVSRKRITLYCENGAWSIIDHQSVNGVFVANKRIVPDTPCDLSMGDMIYIMGLKIIIGAGFLSINDGNQRVILNPDFLQPVLWNTSSSHKTLSVIPNRDKIFNRMPRLRQKLDFKTISIEAPPLSLNSNKIPLLLRMGSSMVMSANSMLAGNFVSVLSMVLFPVLNQKYTDKEKKEYEANRHTKYMEYLSQKEEEILREKQYEEAALNEMYPPTNVILQYPKDGKKLWERVKKDHDFLSLRMGHGTRSICADLDYPQKKFNLNDDELEEEMYRLAERPVYIENVPIMLPLLENTVCSILGSLENKIALAKRLIAQVAFLHSYDEVKMIFLMDEEEMKQLAFLRVLPHVWNDEKTFRYLATNAASAYLIGEFLTKELEEDLVKPRELKKIMRDRPYYVVFAFSKKVFDIIEVFKTVMQEDENLGVSILTFFDDVPKESKELLYLNQNGVHEITYLTETENKGTAFQLDSMDECLAEKMIRRISNTKLNVITQAFGLPKMITFLEMFGVGKVEHLNPLKRWKENNPIKSLAAPVGVGTDGSLFTLDLHEKYQGPHGLVAGMTGSGKSEFLITYILSLAVNFHPDEVSFVLIDYKGGGLAGAFDDPERGVHLPHLVGTITNLDGSAIQRSLMSIESELKRRQRIFNETKSATNEGTMDIYTYQKLYRSGKVSHPMPHLFIISDEFAELKSQEPEFMEKLISAARIGRSLGVHLILATQKPSGVVNDQINSNAKFRVCLKVQTKADSEEMLRRPEAAELKETGRFYLQVGYNEFFALGQSAWCGAPYEPQDKVVIHRDDYVQFIDDAGQNIIQVRPTEEKMSSGKSQLVEVVEYLSDISKTENFEMKKLWLEPLPGMIPLNELQKNDPAPKSGEVRTIIGMVDDPENQTQFLYDFNFSNSGNLLIVGESGCGKTTLLQTILYSLAKKYDPETINFYILDYSSKLLTLFGSLPHCGAAMKEGEETQVVQFFGLLNEIIEERKKLFHDAEVTGFESYCEIKRIPLIFVVIDNIVGLTSWKNGEAIYYSMNLLLREASSYGIHFIITASHANDLMFKIKQELGTRIAMRAKDKYEYTDILNKKCSFIPADICGRGVCLIDDRPLEFQTARFACDGSEQQQIQKLKKELTELTEKYREFVPAKRLPTLPEAETYELFCKDIRPERIPLGYSIPDIKKITIPLKQLYCMSLYLGNPDGIIPIMKNYLYAMIRDQMHFVVIKKHQNSIFENEEIQRITEKQSFFTAFESSEEDSIKLWQLIAEEITKRKPFRNEYCDEHHLPRTERNSMKKCANYIREKTYPFLVLFESFKDYCQNADPSCYNIMPTIFEDGKGYNCYFIGCYYPDDVLSLTTDQMQKSFNQDGLHLLYGGQFHRYSIEGGIPGEYREMKKPLKKFNNCIMKYHDAFYPLVMPCGEIKDDTLDEDDREII